MAVTPSKAALQARLVGKTLDEVPTPSIVLDLAKLEVNCRRMMDAAEKNGLGWRAHIKTHKVSLVMGTGNVFSWAGSFRRRNKVANTVGLDPRAHEAPSWGGPGNACEYHRLDPQRGRENHASTAGVPEQRA